MGIIPEILYIGPMKNWLNLIFKIKTKKYAQSTHF